MVNLSLSKPIHIHFEEGEYLSSYVAAMLLYNTFNDGHKEDQPWIRSNISKLIPICKEKLKFADNKIVYKMKHLKDDSNWNIFLNICCDQNLRTDLNNLLTVNEITANVVDFQSNLVQQVMETKRKNCVHCLHPLKRRFKYRKNKKGTIGVKYSNEIGPILSINYVHDCSNSKCDGVYYHNRYFVNNTLYLENIADCEQMNSKSTFFADDIIEECVSFNHDGVSTALYVEKWNNRFEKRIDEIE